MTTELLLGMKCWEVLFSGSFHFPVVHLFPTVMSIALFCNVKEKESKILRNPWHAFLTWVRSWIFMFKWVSEIQKWFLGNLLGKSCSFPLLLECVLSTSEKMEETFPCHSSLLPKGKKKKKHKHKCHLVLNVGLSWLQPQGLRASFPFFFSLKRTGSFWHVQQWVRRKVDILICA